MSYTVCHVCGCSIHPRGDRHVHERVRKFYQGIGRIQERLICRSCFIQARGQLTDSIDCLHVCNMPYSSPEELQLTAEDEEFMQALGIAVAPLIQHDGNSPNASEQTDRGTAAYIVDSESGYACARNCAAHF